MQVDAVAMIVGGAVGTAAKYLQMSGLSGRFSAVVAAIISALFLAVYGYSAGDFARETAWPYLLVYVQVLMNAAAAFHLAEEAQKKFGTDGTGGARVVLALVAGGTLLLSGCALIQKSPTQPAQADARRQIADVIQRLTLAENIGAEAMRQLADAAINPDLKIAIGCDVLKAIGQDAPSLTVVANCGPIPTRAQAPLQVAVMTAQTVGSCASRQNTIAAALALAQPLWDRLIASGSTALQVLGGSLKFALLPLQTPVPCGGAL